MRGSGGLVASRRILRIRSRPNGACQLRAAYESMENYTVSPFRRSWGSCLPFDAIAGATLDY